MQINQFKIPTKKRNSIVWSYVNGELYIGHLAGYLFPANTYARYLRLIRNDMLIVFSSDYYVAPITVEAEKKQTPYDQLFEHYYPIYKDLFLNKFKFSIDNLTKTTSLKHKKLVQDFFKRGLANGFITTAFSEVFFDHNINKFLPDYYVEGAYYLCGFVASRSDESENCVSVLDPTKLINPYSVNIKNPVDLKVTEYYYHFSKSANFLKDCLETNTSNWQKWVVSESYKWQKKVLYSRSVYNNFVEFYENTKNSINLQLSDIKTLFSKIELVS
jgi:methionyl-tRNA synthetase